MRYNAIIYANRLKEAGLQSKIADIQAEELSNILNDDIATKKDIELLSIEVKKDIELLRLEVMNLKNEVVLKLGRLVIGSTVIISLMIGVLGFLLKG